MCRPTLYLFLRPGTQNIKGDNVELRQAGAQSVQGTTVNVRQGGVVQARTDTLSMTQGGLVFAETKDATLTASTAGAILAGGNVIMDQSVARAIFLAWRY